MNIKEANAHLDRYQEYQDRPTAVKGDESVRSIVFNAARAGVVLRVAMQAVLVGEAEIQKVRSQ